MNAPAPPSPVQEGDVVAEKYVVTRVVAAGGMGVVVAARHKELGHAVALKFLLPTALTGTESVSRFLREARAVVSMKSEHVVRVSDVGTLASGAPYLVMELLEGNDLKEVLERDGPFPIERACDFIIQASEAIAEAHATGIVHRDIKPPNLFMTQRVDGSPLIKVLDFGIAKALGDPMMIADGIATSTTAFLGSPYYMSPEQVRSTKNVDVRTDVWALGAVLYELLVGQPPFQGNSFGVLFDAIMNRTYRAARDLRADIPIEIENAIAKCLEKDLAMRSQTVADLAIAIAPFAPTSCTGEIERIRRLHGMSAPQTSRSPLDAKGRGGADVDPLSFHPTALHHPSPPLSGPASSTPTSAPLTAPPATPDLALPATSQPPLQPSSRTGTAWGNTHHGQRSAAPRWPLMLFALTILLMGGGYVFFRQVLQNHDRAAAASSSSTVSATTPPANISAVPSGEIEASAPDAPPSPPSPSSSTLVPPKPIVVMTTPGLGRPTPSATGSAEKKNPIQMNLQ